MVCVRLYVYLYSDGGGGGGGAAADSAMAPLVCVYTTYYKQASVCLRLRVTE